MKTSVHSWTEKLQSTPQSQICTKKGHGHCLVVCCQSDPLLLNPNKTITSEKYAQQIEMHQKLQHLQRSTGRAQFFSTTMPDQCRTTNTWKVEWIGPHSPYSPDLSPTDYYFFKHLNNFLHGKPFHIQKETENIFQEFVESRGMDFYATGINKHFSLAKMCWL